MTSRVSQIVLLIFLAPFATPSPPGSIVRAKTTDENILGIFLNAIMKVVRLYLLINVLLRVGFFIIKLAVLLTVVVAVYIYHHRLVLFLVLN